MSPREMIDNIIRKTIPYFQVVAGLLVLSAICVVILFLSDRIVMPLVVGQKRVVKVPDLHYLQLIEADSICSKLGLELAANRSRVDYQNPRGTVLDQYPLANAVTKPGRRIEVIVSAGDRQIEFPNFRGRSIYDAWIIADSVGLVLADEDFRYVHSDSIMERVIISQTPAPNTIVSPNTETRIVVSLGRVPENPVMPDFIGSKLDDIHFQLAKLKLRVGRVSNLPDRRNPPMTILSQEPKPGEEIHPEQLVHFSVAVKPQARIVNPEEGE